MTTGVVVVLGPAPSDREAVRIARTLVEERLAAAANVVPGCRSRTEGIPRSLPRTPIGDSVRLSDLCAPRAVRVVSGGKIDGNDR